MELALKNGTTVKIQFLLCFRLWVFPFIFLSTLANAENQIQKTSELPREFHQIQLLTSVKEVKKKLKELNLKIADEMVGSHPTLEIPYKDTYFIVVDDPTKEFSAFMFSFYQGKLRSIRIEYNMRNKSTNFEQILSKLEEAYGKPNEILDKSETLFGIKSFIYHWVDEVTEMGLGYSPPGEVPIFGQPHLGALDWIILDRSLSHKLNEEIERATNQFKQRREERIEKK